MSAMAHIVSQSGDNANMTDDYRKIISTVEAAIRVRGSKAFMVGWFTYTGMLWTLKICMLAFLRRITNGLPSARFAKPIFYVVLLSWIAYILLFFTACRPFQQYWQIYPRPQGRRPAPHLPPICMQTAILGNHAIRLRAKHIHFPPLQLLHPQRQHEPRPLGREALAPRSPARE
jgi:hypothetical protein